MTTLNDIILNYAQQRFATTAGTKMHAALRKVTIDGTHSTGEPDLIAKITGVPLLAKFFCAESKTEVPIAGTINGRFISRRIDRLFIDSQKKTVTILDYKTDQDRTAFYNSYVAQIREYATLLQAVYPEHIITAYILWTHDFSLENIPLK